MERAGDVPSAAYVLGHSEQELRRLRVQARLIDPITRHFFLEAGVTRGMQLLDVGTGAGDTAFLGAKLVGPQGTVTGVDRSAVALATARARASEQGLGNVTFVEGDPSEIAFAQPFDAVTGRYVLMFQPDPILMLRKLKRLLRPGGLIVFHEPDWEGAGSFPPAPIYDSCRDWVVEALRQGKADTEMASKLHLAFMEAGLPAPTMRTQSVIGAAANAGDQMRLTVDLAVSMAAKIIAAGIATVQEMDVDTLVDRAMREVIDNRSMVVGRRETAAWARV